MWHPSLAQAGDQPGWFWGAKLASRGFYTVVTKLRKAGGPSCLCSPGQPKTQFTFLGVSLPNCEHSQGGPPRLFLGGKRSVLGHFGLHLPMSLRGSELGEKG